MYKLTPKEIEVMTKKSAKDRYVYFIKRVADWGSLWILKDEDGIVSTQGSSGALAFPVWPFKEYASLCTIDEWENSKATKISLKEFIKKYIPNFITESTEVAVFMVPNSSEIVMVEAERLLKDLNNESSKYE